MKASRRAFLIGLTATTALAVLPGSPASAQETPTIINMVKNSNGTYSMDATSRAAVGSQRAAIFEAASNKALAAAQARNLTMAQGRGLLSRIAGTVFKARGRGGLVGGLVQAGLLVGLTWALTSGTTITNDGTSIGRTDKAQTCGTANVPGSILDVGTAVYRNGGASSQGLSAYQTVFVPQGSTLPTPSGWSLSYQNNANGLTRYVFTKRFACDGSPIEFAKMPLSQLQDMLPKNEEGTQIDTTTSSQVVDGVVDDAVKAPLPSNTSSPVANVPADFTVPRGGYPAPGITVSDVTTPTTAPFPGPVEVQLPTGTLPEDAGTPTPTPTPAPSGTPPTTIDWGSPPADEPLNPPTPMSWFPSWFTAPDLPGSCSGVPYDFRPSLNVSGMINPCPAIDGIRPIIRPVSILGWTSYALRTMLDL